jgi:glycosyltransferase involved in cell wall biosynthesis
MAKFDFSIITITKEPNMVWLSETLESVQNQVCKNFEHIVLDASSNETYSEIASLVNSLGDKSNIMLCKQISKGIWAAFDEAYAMCNGEFVGVINSDDYYYQNNVLSKVIATLKQNKFDYCYGNSQRVNQHKEMLYLHKPLKFLSKKNYDFFVFNISHHTLFFRKSILNDINFYTSSTRAVDLDFMRRLYHSQYAGGYLNKTIAGFRIHENNFSSTYSKNDTMRLFVEWNSLPSFVFFFSRMIVFIFNPKYFAYYLNRFFKKKRWLK